MSNMQDQAYIDYLQRLSARYKANTAGRSVFNTNLDTTKMWEEFLSSFTDRQYHNCNSCRHFLNRYAGLVVVEPDGATKSALWNVTDVHDGDSEHAIAIERLRKIAERAEIAGVFYDEHAKLGYDVHGPWRHLNVDNPTMYQFLAPQSMAQKREEYNSITRLLKEKAPTAEALALVNSGALFRAERVKGPLEWLAKVQAECKGKKNLVWLAIATAPQGYAHIRGSMAGSLLKDIAEGRQTPDITKRFNTKMDDYQQAQKPVSSGQVKAAEKAVEELGIAPAFARRYTDEFDVLAGGGVLWQPSELRAWPKEQPSEKPAGVFSGLAPAPATKNSPTVDVPPKTMTWEKFARDVLPQAAAIGYRVPQVGRFCALTTAVDNHAPPILQWDLPDARNPIAWAFPNPPATAEEWNLQPGTLAPVKAIVASPNLWGEKPQLHQGQGVFLLLDGAHDTRGMPGGGLFVEHLRSELKPYRATIEAHLNRLLVAGADKAMAFGIGLLDGNDWTQTDAPRPVSLAQQKANAPDFIHVLLVMDDSGSMAQYLPAARKALRSLLDAINTMPGQVDVSILKFGTKIDCIGDRVRLSDLRNIEKQLNGRSGNTALNDAVAEAMTMAWSWPQHAKTSYFLGIVTDGEENASKRHSHGDVRAAVQRCLATGVWTIAFAGAGHNPGAYAARIGMPEGNVAAFEASARGFEDIGSRYATASAGLGAVYKSGVRSSTSFFSAVSGRKPIGTDYPVLEVVSKSGSQLAYKLDRFE